MIAIETLRFRTILPMEDAALAAANRHDACVASFGADGSYEGDSRYLKWLVPKVEEFPDGFVLALRGDRCVGQMELEVPYGAAVGYVNLFYVRPEFRRLGLGRAMHAYAERYFRSWEAQRIELHVSPTNHPAMQFYKTLGYRPADGEHRRARLLRMARTL